MPQNLIKLKKMRDLKKAAALRTANESVKTAKGERKNLFLELLKDNEMNRKELETKMAAILEERHNEKQLPDEEFLKLVASVSKSVSNYCSRSLRPSTAKATFNGDPAYAQYELKQNKTTNTLIITERA